MLHAEIEMMAHYATRDTQHSLARDTVVKPRHFRKMGKKTPVRNRSVPGSGGTGEPVKRGDVR